MIFVFAQSLTTFAIVLTLKRDWVLGWALCFYLMSSFSRNYKSCFSSTWKAICALSLFCRHQFYLWSITLEIKGFKILNANKSNTAFVANPSFIHMYQVYLSQRCRVKLSCRLSFFVYFLTLRNFNLVIFSLMNFGFLSMAVDLETKPQTK